MPWDQLLGPLALTVGALLAVVALWHQMVKHMADLRASRDALQLRVDAADVEPASPVGWVVPFLLAAVVIEIGIGVLLAWQRHRR